MKQNIIHIGLDVDDTQYHGSVFNKETGEVVDFKSRPTLKGLLQQLDRMARHFKGYKIKLCYEASYVGYCLQRDLISKGVYCFSSLFAIQACPVPDIPVPSKILEINFEHKSQVMFSALVRTDYIPEQLQRDR